MIEAYSLIPFGLHVESQQLIDVGNVKRGNDCGCICPSCKTPLVARHGNKKAWHFAHRSQGVHRDTRKDCEYSFVVSVRLMIRQLSENGLKFKTPCFENSLEVFSKHTFKSTSFSYVVTEEQQLELNNVKVGVQFSGVVVDVLGYIQDIPFIIYVTYQDRPIPTELDPPLKTKCGIVELNVDYLQRLFQKEENGQYIELLRKYIEDEVSDKSWVYHPREQRLKASAHHKCELWLSQQASIASSRPKERHHDLYEFIPEVEPAPEKQYEPMPPKAENYTCIMCNHSWRGVSRTCIKCGTHLFSTEK